MTDKNIFLWEKKYKQNIQSTRETCVPTVFKLTSIGIWRQQREIIMIIDEMEDSNI